MLNDSSPRRSDHGVEPPSRARDAVAVSAALLVAVAVVLAVVGGACAHDAPAAVTSSPVARRPPPVRRPAPKVATAETPPPVQVPAPGEAPAIFFDFDSALLRQEARPELQQVTAALGARREATLRVEGNCDQLGTIEYNLAPGEHRAEAAKRYLVQLGVPAGRITTVSYGAERPKYTGAREDERAKNRRDDLVLR